MFDVKAFIADLHEYIARALSPLSNRMDELERLVAERPKGEPGVAGVGLAGAVIDRHGALVVTLSNGEAVNLGPVVGRDGFDLSDFSARYDGERGLTLTFESGDIKRECALHLPVVIHRGFWREETKARAGDAWTSGGSLWIARADTNTKPCFENREHWTLAARGGRDGQPGAPGRDYAPPPAVKLKNGKAANA